MLVCSSNSDFQLLVSTRLSKLDVEFFNSLNLDVGLHNPFKSFKPMSLLDISLARYLKALKKKL